MILFFHIASFLFFIAQITTSPGFVRQGHLNIQGYVSTCCFTLFTSKTLCATVLFSVPRFLGLVCGIFWIKVTNLLFVFFVELCIPCKFLWKLHRTCRWVLHLISAGMHSGLHSDTYFLFITLFPSGESRGLLLVWQLTLLARNIGIRPVVNRRLSNINSEPILHVR